MPRLVVTLAFVANLYRNGTRIASVQGTTDATPKGPGTYTYLVCAVNASMYSNESKVSF